MCQKNTVLTGSSTNNVGLAASASSGLPVSFTVGTGSASISGGTNLTFTGAGTVSIVALQTGNVNWVEAPAVTNTFNVTKAYATVTLTNLSQTYDGTARVVGYESVPSGLSVLLTYDGYSWAPTNVGSYTVTGVVNDVMYQGATTGTLVVGKGSQVLTDFVPTNGSAFVTTNWVGLSATASSGLQVLFSTNMGPGAISGGTNLAFTAEGLVDIVASQTGDVNWIEAPALTNRFSVTKAYASVTLTNLNQAYDGTARVVTSQTSPTGLTVNLTYDGHSWAPTNVGSYTVTGVVNDVMYQGAVTGTLVVGKGSQVLTDFVPTNGSAFVTTNWVGLSATASSGLQVLFSTNGGPAVLSDGTNLSFTGTGTVSIVASQTGDVSWIEAPALTNTFSVTKATASVTLTNLSQMYDGTARVVGYESVPSGLSVLLTYDGHFWAPTNAGSYTVTGTVDDVMYQGGQVSTLVVARIGQTINFPIIGNQEVTNVVELAATASSGLAVSFTTNFGPAVIADGTNLSFTATGLVSIVASQAGNVNYDAAPNVTNTFWVGDPTLLVLGTDGQVITNNEVVSAAKGTDFGYVSVGRTVTNVLAVTNNGNAIRTISSWATNGTGANAFALSNLPTNVQPGVASNFTIAFSVNVVGVYTAEVVIVHSGTNTPYVVNVRGISFETTTNSGSSGGGNRLVLTNGVPFGTNITNVVVCGVQATVVTQGEDWVEIQLGSGGNGTGDIVVQLETGTPVVYPNAYTYIYSGGGGGGEEAPTVPSGPDFRVKQTLITPSKLKCSGKFIVWVQVENKGSAKGDAGYLSLTVDGKYFGSVKIGTLDKKKTKVVRFTNVKSAKKYTPIVLTLKVDCYNVTKETNESNNTTTKNVSCK